MRTLRFSFSLGRCGFELSLWRKAKRIRSRGTHLKLSRKSSFLRGHSLSKHPLKGGAPEVEKKYKYSKLKKKYAYKTNRKGYRLRDQNLRGRELPRTRSRRVALTH